MTGMGTQLGKGRTPAELAVESALADVPFLVGRPVRYRPVHGGLQNENWQILVEGESTSYFVKIPGSGSDAYIDRDVAHEAARTAADLGIGASTVWYDHDNHVEFFEFLDGYRACTNGDLKGEGISRDIVELYRRFHSAPRLSLTKTVFDMIEEHLAQVNELKVQIPQDFDLVMREYRAARTSLESSGIDIAPCHNDPMPGNFLISDGRPMKVVDFEFSSNNDPAYELAVFITEMFFDDYRSMDLIEAYYGKLEWSTVSRVQVYGALADVKWGLWGLVYHRLSEGWGFDYHKYGAWKMMRARIKMSDPRWGLWMASL